MTEPNDVLTLLLAGDVMLGRGVDQILARPGDPTLRESWIKDARAYVHLAEEASGPIPVPVADTWPWGDALEEIERSRPAVLVLNLETSVTADGDFAEGKAVNYRMSPGNIGALCAAGPDVCVLANNHSLDFGRSGLEDTLDTLEAAGLVVAGAGRDRDSAESPVVVAGRGGAPVAVLAFALPSSGTPRAWAATRERAGIAVLPDLSDRTADGAAARVSALKEQGAVVVVSLHWGSNWGYGVDADQVSFAHRVIDAGADVVHGHSSHHPRPLEVYRDRLVLYGCGDLVNDYEGIRGYEEYRDDLRLLYRLELGPEGALHGLELLPFRSRRIRLERAVAADVGWLAARLSRESRRFGVRLEPTDGGTITAERG